MKSSDICLSVRSIKESGDVPGSENYALKLIDELKPTRIEWSYITDRDLIARIKAKVPVFVAALNTIFPPGHAVNFEGSPIIAPWMTQFGSPGKRYPYICQNNPEDLQHRINQAVELIAENITDTFQFDDWFGNAQMYWYPNCCFCEYCQQEFSRDLGININYRDYLRGRGYKSTGELFKAAEHGEVPVWEDYKRFHHHTVTRFFRILTKAMEQALGRTAILSVNGSVFGFGGDIDTIKPFISYLNGETNDFTPDNLYKMAVRSRELNIRQIVSFFPDVTPADYHNQQFVGRIKQSIGLCYCLGLLPLFPYDVYTGNDPATGKLNPRWFGTVDEYIEPYEYVRKHSEWIDDYTCDNMTIENGIVTIDTVNNTDSKKKLRHIITEDGKWQTKKITGEKR